MRMLPRNVVPLMFAVALIPPPALFAQGTITGRVVDARTMGPLGAQVSVPALDIGSISGANGRFLLTNVPVGTHQLRVEMIGYRTVTREVTVATGESVEVNFQLAEEALALDEIVVTGTAGGTQRRAVGNVVDRISMTELREITPAQDVSQLIGQRSAGVVMLGAAGAVGTGTRIRIRGAGSMGLNNDPIIYIDGVRMDGRSTAGPTQRGGAKVSRLNDINPDDIESIEIIKGPAAATLYGTEASNGVIQIITKRGQTGAPRFDIMLRTGTHWLWNPAGRQGLSYATDPATGQLVSFNVYEHERQHGLGDIFQYGALYSLSGNVSGGTEGARYFVSGAYSDDTGVRPENWDRRFNVRTNLDLMLTDQLTGTLNMGYVEGTTRLAQGGFDNDPFSNIYWANPLFVEHNRGYFRAPPEEWGKVDDRINIDRFTGSVQLNWRPREWFSHRLVTGLDNTQEEVSSLTPRQPEGRDHFFAANALGVKNVNRIEQRVFTFDYGASASVDLTARLIGTSSVGFQYYRARSHSVGGSGSEFPATPLTTLSGAANRNSFESLTENATVGVFVQQQFGWQNRVFLTGAIRADDNSAFGSEFDAAIYPKLSATWVLSEEPFWSIDWVEQLRLRAAWGAAGQQPGTFDAARLLAPGIGHNDQPVLLPSAFGNPTLRPERSEELELGFDAGLFDGRVNLIYTRFQRRTTDAIVSSPIPASLGWPGAQIVNLGRVKGWGNEVSLDVDVLGERRIGWDVGLQLATFGNRILDLGPDTDFIGGNQSRHHVGYSIGDMYYRTVLSAEIDAEGRVLSALCDGGAGPHGVEQGGAPVPCAQAPFVRWGPTQPTWEAGVNSTLRFGAFRIYGRVDALGGHYQEDSSSPAAITSLQLTRLSNTRDDPFVQAYGQIGRQPLGTYKGGFARLRELSATYSLPEAFAARLGASRGSITLAGRNLMMLWTAEHGWGTSRDGLVQIPIGDGKVWDPETRSMGDLAGSYQTVMPPLTSANLTVRFSF